MLTEYNKAIVSDLRNKRNLEFEVNFSDDPIFKETVRVTMGSEEAIISFAELYNFLLIAGTPDQQDGLMPVKQTLVNKIIKRHVVAVKKDMRKGELMNVRCETNVPVEIVEGFKGMMSKKSFLVRK